MHYKTCSVSHLSARLIAERKIQTTNQGNPYPSYPVPEQPFLQLNGPYATYRLFNQDTCLQSPWKILFARILTMHILLLLYLFRMFAPGEHTTKIITPQNTPLRRINMTKQLILYYLFFMGFVTSALATYQNYF